MDIDVRSILRNPAEAKVLLNAGEQFGIHARLPSRGSAGVSNILNLGTRYHEDMEPVFKDDQPNASSSDMLRLVEEVDISYKPLGSSANATVPGVAKLSSFRIIPENREGIPQISFEKSKALSATADADQDSIRLGAVADDDNLQLEKGSSTRFLLQLFVPRSYSGALKRLLLFSFDVKERLNAFAQCTTSFTVGILILGNVMPRPMELSLTKVAGSANASSIAAFRSSSDLRHDSSSSSASASTLTLSVEAKPFTPMAAVTYFDHPVELLGMEDGVSPLYHRRSALRVPARFHELMQVLIPRFAESAIVEHDTQYIVHERLNNLDRVMLRMDLNNLGDVKEQHSGAMSSMMQCRQLLENYRKLVLLEEIQMKVDIAQYDLHFVQLEAQPLQLQAGSVGSTMIAKLCIRGSNESRPRIRIGDEIRLRPVHEDLHLLPVRWLQTHSQFFEIRGIALNYSLSSEEVLYEFPMIPDMWVGEGLQLFNNLRFHARFTVDQCGPVLMRQALQYTATNPYLMECFFPNQQTIARLDNFFKCNSPVSPLAGISSDLYSREGSPMHPSSTGGGSIISGCDSVDSSDGGKPGINSTGIDNLVSAVPYVQFGFSANRYSGQPSPESRSSSSTRSVSSGNTQTPRKGKNKHALSTSNYSNTPVGDVPSGYNAYVGIGYTSHGSKSGVKVSPGTTSATSLAPTHVAPALNRQQHRAVSLISTLAANQRLVPLTQETQSNYLHEYYSEIEEKQQHQQHQERAKLFSSLGRHVPAPPPVSIRPSAIHLPMPPLIIFGPPGTGKTRTIIEAIRKICVQQPHRRILACAPSDAAADVLCKRLLTFLDNKHLFRLNWWQRSAASVPTEVKPYCNEAEGLYELPSSEQLLEFQVVVSTCGVAGALGNLPTVVEFDVVMVDEASQAIEAEVIVPLTFCKAGGLMVLAGDPKQLGPCQRCPLYSCCCDNVSMQERLLRLPFYADCWPSFAVRKEKVDPFSPSSLNKQVYVDGRKVLKRQPVVNDEHACSFPLGVFLYRNYRSHKVILEVPSQLFYEGALRVCGDKKQIESLCRWQRLPQHRHFPLLFIGVDGTHLHDKDSPSFYNEEEIEKVVDVCKELLSSSRFANEDKVQAKEIGVIAAFRQQVLRIRLRLRSEGLSSVNVGSVEDFQGQEMRVIVISTVLSTWEKRFTSMGCTGLVGDEKRFNVALTRAMSLCVVIGQPYLLYSDRCWQQLLKYCHANGSYSGMSCEHFELRRSSAPTMQHSNNSLTTRCASSDDISLEKQISTLSFGSLDHEVVQVDDDLDAEDDLLNSLTEVANAMLGGITVEQNKLPSANFYARYDLEWRSIM